MADRIEQCHTLNTTLDDCVSCCQTAVPEDFDYCRLQCVIYTNFPVPPPPPPPPPAKCRTTLSTATTDTVRSRIRNGDWWIPWGGGKPDTESSQGCRSCNETADGGGRELCYGCCDEVFPPDHAPGMNGACKSNCNPLKPKEPEEGTSFSIATGSLALSIRNGASGLTIRGGSIGRCRR